MADKSTISKSSILDCNRFRHEDLDKLDLKTRELVERREACMGSSYRLFYKRPLNLVRGEGEYLWDADGNKYLDTGYVDHGYEAADFVDAVLNDEDLLLRCLFGTDSCVYTGNDNSAEKDDMCYCAIATDEHWNGKEWVETINPNHEPDKYDYFYKGN